MKESDVFFPFSFWRQKTKEREDGFVCLFLALFLHRRLELGSNVDGSFSKARICVGRFCFFLLPVALHLFFFFFFFFFCVSVAISTPYIQDVTHSPHHFPFFWPKMQKHEPFCIQKFALSPSLSSVFEIFYCIFASSLFADDWQCPRTQWICIRVPSFSHTLSFSF